MKYLIYLSVYGSENKKLTFIEKTKEKYILYNQNNYFKYGKYIAILIPIVIFAKNYYKKFMFRTFICSKEDQKKAILKNYIVEDIVKELNNQEKFEFLSKSSLRIIQSNNYELNIKHLDEDLKNKIKNKIKNVNKKNIFTIVTNDKLFGFYTVNKKLPDELYEIECSNTGAYINNKSNDEKCSIISSKHGFLHYFFRLKKLNLPIELENFQKSLFLFKEFLEIFNKDSINDSTLKNNFHELIKKNNHNDWMKSEKLDLDNYFIEKGTQILNNHINQNINYSNEDIEKLINSVFDKLVNIITDIQDLGNYFLTIVAIKYFFQLFNNSIEKIDKKYSLPYINVEFPLIKSISILDPFLNINTQVHIISNHLQYHFYTLNKEEALEFKKLIEEFIKKYEEANKNNLKIILKTHSL